jgi:hypothetical protein
MYTILSSRLSRGGARDHENSAILKTALVKSDDIGIVLHQGQGNGSRLRTTGVSIEGLELLEH